MRAASFGYYVASTMGRCLAAQLGWFAENTFDSRVQQQSAVWRRVLPILGEDLFTRCRAGLRYRVIFLRDAGN